MAPSTPCTRICVLQAETGLCEGCGRTRDEIARWSRMSETERLAVMAVLPGRMPVARPILAGRQPAEAH